ncbi:hypothetical protein EIP86_010409, partial [Pleurotus ostreatoroseus]
MGDVSTTESKGSIHIEEEIPPTRAEYIEKKTYTSQHTGPPVLLSTEEEKRIYRKIDLRLIPVMTLLQLLSFMDRGAVQFMRTRGVVYTEEAEQAILIVWGVIMTLMGLVQTYPQLVGTRVVLGAVEAGLFPGVTWYLSMWYPRHMLQYRVGVFWGGATIAGAFSGLLAFGISFMDGIIEGLTTVVGGIIAAIVLVDFPDTAKFLTEEEKAYVIWRKSRDIDQDKCPPKFDLIMIEYDNSSVGEEERFAFRYIWAAVFDWQ